MLEKPVFNYTLHKKFWDLISKVGYYSANFKDEACLFCLKKNIRHTSSCNLMTIKETIQIINMENECVACQYDTDMREYRESTIEDCFDGNCDNCPLYVPREVFNKIPVKFQKLGFPCLDGLYHWIYHISCRIGISISTGKLVDKLAQEERILAKREKLFDEFIFAAKLIKDLPVKEGVDYV